MAEHFPYSAPLPTLEGYLAGLPAKVQLALQRIGMYDPPPAVARSFRVLFRETPWPLHSVAEETARTLENVGVSRRAQEPSVKRH